MGQMSVVGTSKPTLCGATVTLRPEAAEAALEMVQDEETRRLTGTQATFTLEGLKGWYGEVGAREDRIDLAITRQRVRERGRPADVGYGFGTLGLNRASLEVFVFNARAVHVYEKLGFRREGRLREVLYAGGAYHDAIVMSLLRHEYGATASTKSAAPTGSRYRFLGE